MSSFLADLAESLPQLLRTLREQGMDVGHDQYLSAVDLFTLWAAAAEEPSKATIRTSLAAVFCTTPEEQQQFKKWFDDWYPLQPASEEPAQPETPQSITWTDRFQQKTWFRYLPIALTLLAVVLVYGVLELVTDQPGPVIESPVEMTDPGTPATPSTTQPEERPASTARPAETRPLPPLSYIPAWGKPLQYLWLIPVGLWLLLMLWLLVQRHLVLHRGKADDDVDLTQITFTADSVPLFQSDSLEPFWRSLRAFRAAPSQRLDVQATIKRSLDNGGFFQPVYRQRQQPPAYLVLWEQQHRQDHSAGLARAFVKAMRHQHLQVTALYYRSDPRHSRRPNDPGSSHHPATLASVYGDHDLLLLGGGNGLMHPWQQRMADWTQAFTAWPRKLFLSYDPLWPQSDLTDPLEKLGFRSAPLSTEALQQLPQNNDPLIDDNLLDLPLPRLFQQDPLRWIQGSGWQRKDWAQAVNTLKHYMGREGFLLLAATAAYPELNWSLTRALDAQLKLAADTREWRLRKLARLPWYRHAFLPDGLRYAIIRQLKQPDLERITGAYNALMNQKGDKPLQLPVAVPDWQDQKKTIRKTAQQAPPGSVLADRILASVIQGRKPKPTEFELPLDALKRNVSRSWRSLARPALLGVVLIPGAIWLNLWFWQSTAKDWVRASATKAMLEESQGVQVGIDYLPKLEAHAQNLAEGLRARGFTVDSLQSLQATQTSSQNRIMWNGLPTQVLENLQQGLAYSSYQTPYQTNTDTTLPTQQAQIQLVAQPGVYQDALIGNTLIEPEMVKIPAGCFQMGSPETEPERRKDERLHEVCVERFEMGKYEVTFAEYDAYVEATGKKKPDDSGWGRGRRPVINVSWQDATGYAQWLSEQTGKPYRLPTEAEWEFAARAGTTTPFHTGNCISTDQANYGGNFSYQDCPEGEYRGKTLEVGQFGVNPWGLYDVHGNVWEWTCSLYNADYNGAETRCADKGVSRRVLRGGSWSNEPRFVRSASRNWLTPVTRLNNIGFRLARTL